MSTEPMATTAVPAADTSERGLLIAMVLLVLLGGTAMMFMA